MTTSTIIVLRAADGMVLCDGETMTSVGGRVTCVSESYAQNWLEMTPQDAEALIARNHPETEQDGDGDV